MTGARSAGGRPAGRHGLRLSRLLAMVPWLIEEGGASVGDIAQRFGVDEEEVVRDLELVGLCGVPPYGGGDLIDVWVDDEGFVHAYPGPFFTRPMQLTPAEGFAVLAAGQALLAVPGADHLGSLASALATLEAALGRSPLDVDLVAPDHLEAVRSAAERHERLEVTYYSAWRDEVTERRLDPHLVHNADGQWYVEAHCHRAGGMRRFRVDRLESVRPTGEHFAAQEFAPPIEVFGSGPETRDLVVLGAATTRRLLEAAPASSIEQLPDGRLRAVIPVAGTAFAERLLLRLGPGVEVLAPLDLAMVGRHAADRILARYDPNGDG